MTRDQRYNRSEKGRARYRRYRESAKGRANERRVNARHRVRDRETQITRTKELMAHSQVHRED